jgi:cytochrome c-type biogenesis protein CcmH/NrfG
MESDAFGMDVQMIEPGEKDKGDTTHQAERLLAAQTNLEKLQKEIEVNPLDAMAWMNLGRANWAIGEKEMAFQCFDQVLRLRPDLAPLRAWMAKTRGETPKNAVNNPTKTE